MNDSILRHEENGVEFFTLRATGESGLSQRGLARACGVRLSSIQHIEQNLTDKARSKWLQKLVGQDIYLTNDSVASGKQGKKVRPYNALFCSAVIQHFAFSGKDVAQETLSATSGIGFNSYVQGKTGWLPNDYQSSKKSRQQLDRILTHPRKWSAVNKKEMCAKIQKWFGFDCSKFYWWYVYSFFTKEEVVKHDIHNPIQEYVSPKTGKKRTARKSRVHQHLNEETAAKLVEFNDYLWRLVEVCDSRAEFEKKWANKYGQPVQLEIFDLWDFAS